MLIALPTFSSGATVKNDLRSFDSVQPRATFESADPKVEPPLHGTNPHGQGTAVVIDLQPDATRPYTVDGAGTSEDEDIVIGRSRGEQRADGTYHGHITVAALFGNEIIEAADTGPGETEFGSLADDVLDPLCASTGICLGLVEFSSSTTDTGSSNSFRAASVSLGGPTQLPGAPELPGGAAPSVEIGAAESFGDINSNGTCQSSRGGSKVLDVSIAGSATAEVAEATSESIACRGGTSSQANSSQVIQLGATALSVPLLLSEGCADGTPDTVTGLPTLLPIVCHANDSSETEGGNQADDPAHVYGVRHALDVYLLEFGPSALAQVSAAQAESLAVAPAQTPTTTTPTTTVTTPGPTTTVTTPGPTTTGPTVTVTTPGGTTTVVTPSDDGGTAGDDDAGDDGDDGAGAGDDGAGAGDDGDGAGAGRPVSLAGNQLPFTGTDVVVLGLAGSLLLAAGLTLRGPPRRRELDA